MLIELSKLSTAQTVREYNDRHQKLNVHDLTQLFKANEVCEGVHQLQTDLASGFGDISDSVVVGAVSKLKDALGEFANYEYSLATRYPATLSADERLGKQNKQQERRIQ